jgi:hypothetical protein
MYYTPETLLNHVFEDLRRRRPPKVTCFLSITHPRTLNFVATSTCVRGRSASPPSWVWARFWRRCHALCVRRGFAHAVVETGGSSDHQLDSNSSPSFASSREVARSVGSHNYRLIPGKWASNRITFVSCHRGEESGARKKNGPRPSIVQRTGAIRDRNTPSRIVSQPLTRDRTGVCWTRPNKILTIDVDRRGVVESWFKV